MSAAVRRDPTFGTDVLTSAVLDFDGRQATFTCATQLESDQRVHLLGTAGRLEVEIPFNIPPDRPTRVVLAAGGDPPVAPELTVFELPPCDQYTVQGDAFSAPVATASGADAPRGRPRQHARSSSRSSPPAERSTPDLAQRCHVGFRHCHALCDSRR